MKTIPLIAWFRRAAIALAAVLFAASPAWASKYASIVVDMETGEVLHDRDADEARHPASLTKVMTLYLVFDAIESGKLRFEKIPFNLHDLLPSLIGMFAYQAKEKKLKLEYKIHQSV